MLLRYQSFIMFVHKMLKNKFIYYDMLRKMYTLHDSLREKHF